MKRLFLLLVVIPFLGFAQNTLVKWYRSDLQPTLVENHITSAHLSGAIHYEYWELDAFYTTNGNYSTSSSPEASKYIQFTLSPEAGYQIKLSNFTFSVRKQGGDDVQKIQVQYSKNANFSNAQVLLGETVVNTTYANYSPSFPAETKVVSGETVYVRLFVYNTYNNLHVEHNQAGTVGPAISGVVSLFTAEAPKAFDDKTSTLKNASLNIDILANDNYVSSGTLTKITATKPTHGTVVVNNVKDVTYTPDSNYVGYDSFYYTLTNAVGESNTAKVEIQVLEGVETILERWNKTDFMPVNYVTGITGSKLQAFGGMSVNNFGPQWISNVPYNSFIVGGLSMNTNLNGTLDPTKYIQFSIKSTLADTGVVLKKLNLQYNAQGTGNFSIKYSKDPNFTTNVATLVNNKSYTESAYSQWFNVDESFAAGTVIYPDETVYVRIYVYNASYSTASFYIRTGVSNDTSVLNGMTISGLTAALHEEPCSKTVTWNGASWNSVPTIDKKAILNGDYNTSINGNFSACNLVVNSGKLTIASKNSVTVTNEIKVSADAFLEVQNNGNLVQVNDAANPNTGNAVVLKDIRIREKRTQYNYLGSPVAFEAGQNMKTIYPGQTYVLAYNESTNLFSNSNGIVPAGKGLALKEPTLAGVAGASTPKVTATFKGVPQNGEINYALAYSNNATTSAFGYNLLANPYPSNIDLKKLYDLNKETIDINPTFYFWDNAVNADINQTQQGSNYNGQAYAAFNAKSGTNGMGNRAAGYLNNSENGKKIPTNIMSVGQGFLVRARTGGSVFKFNNSVRTTANIESEFFGKEATEQEDRFWLKMVTPANLKTSIGVVYFEGGSNDLGDEDSDARSSSDYLFSIVNDKSLAIDGRTIFSKSDKLLLGTQHFAAGNYTIAIDKAEGVFANGQKIFLKDTQKGIITDLSLGEYTFAANAGMNTGRFEIVYQPEITLATDAAVKEEIVVYKDSGDFVVKASSKKITALELFDMSGRLVYHSKPNTAKVVISSAQLNNGLYIIKVTQGETVTAKKIIK